MNIDALRSALLRWFRNHGRRLPWRQEYDPYHVWLSEVMLQQTQMDRGVVYFLRWLKRFPDIASVAKASSYEIMKYWEGLGYYARARNLHQAARLMVLHHDGRVPSRYDDLLRLPGIGPYTAAAIASIAFNSDHAVIDANVERVFARLFDIDKPLKDKEVRRRLVELAHDLLPPGQARYFNQALMDLGGLVCTPRNPDCGNCPVAACCSARRGNIVGERPVRKKPKQLIAIDMATALLVKRGHVFIQQRNNDDIWGGLWEFPGGRVEQGESAEEAVVREYREETGFAVEICRKITVITHYYTQYKVTLHCYLCRLPAESQLPELNAAQNYHWIEEAQLDNYAFPSGHRKFIEYLRRHMPASLLEECR